MSALVCGSERLRSSILTIAVPDDPTMALRRRFFPRSALRALLDASSVEDALKCRCDKCRPYHRHINENVELIDHIDSIIGKNAPEGQSSTGLFSLLVYIRCPLMITGFLEFRLTDSWLDSRTTTPDHIFRELATSVWKKFNAQDSSGCRYAANEFRDAVFQFSVPRFTESMYQKFHRDVILPFLNESLVGSCKDDEEDAITSDGAYGIVYSFEILDEYNKFEV